MKYEIRTTDLESYSMCPYLYKHRWEVELTPEQKDNRDIALGTGKKLHKSMQSYLSWSFNPETKERDRNEKSLELIEPELNEKESKYINNCVTLANRHNLPNFMVTENEYIAEFDVGKDKVEITWHVDWIVDSDYIVDIKSSKNKWTEDSLKHKLQRKMYPVLYALARYDKESLHEINLKFDYWIFTKQVTPQFQGFRMNVNIWQSYWEIAKLVKDYVLSDKTNSYRTNPGSSACFRCPLKKTHKCPAYAWPVKE